MWATNSSITTALVAGVPIPFFSAFSSKSAALACSIADNKVSSVKDFGGLVKCTDFLAGTFSNVIPFSISGSCDSSCPCSDLSEFSIFASIDFQPMSTIVRPDAVNILPSHVTMIFTDSYLCGSDTAHNNLNEIRDKIFFSPVGKSSIFSDLMREVGIIA